MQFGFDLDIEQEFLLTKCKLDFWEKREETRVAQITKKNWPTSGDNNTKFFYVVINQRKISYIWSMRLDNGTTLDSPKDIHMGALHHF